MARTPLLHSIQKQFGRRQFIRGAAGAAILAQTRSAWSGNQPRIAVIGGGISGLSAALQLADNGIASTVYESSGRVGGRMFSNASYWNEGQVSEWGGELIDTGHKTILALAKRFHLAVADLRGGEPNGSEDTYQFAGQ